MPTPTTDPLLYHADLGHAAGPGATLIMLCGEAVTVATGMSFTGGCVCGIDRVTACRSVTEGAADCSTDCM